MIEKAIQEIGVEDLERLRANRVPESRSLEYKQALPAGTDGDRKEFLADVTSFANGVGGDLIYGVAEAREDGKPSGVPESVDGLAGVNQDAELRRLENILRDGVAPRLPGVQFRWVEGLTQGAVLIIRIPRSWAGPHMVTFQQHSRFYSRNASGKYALDVFELRQSFLGSGSLRERAREFRAERLGRILAGELPTPMSSARYVCVHVLPHAALAGAIDVDLLLAANQGQKLEPLYARSWGHRFNLDGFLTYGVTGSGPSMAYLQVHRNGCLETVSSELLATGREGRVEFPSTAFARHLIQFVHRARALLKELNVDPPASLMVSLLGARGALLAIHDDLRFYSGLEANPFDRDELLLRDVLLTDWEEGDALHILRPLFDELWQAAGLARCFDFDDQGKWKR